MELHSACALLGCGLVMGALNQLAGAAGALGLAGLEVLAGLDPVSANASLRPSAVLIGFSGWLGFKSRGKAVPRRAWLYGLMAVPGAAVGGWAAIALSEWIYRVALVLILIAVLLQQLRGTAIVPAPRSALPGWAAVGLFLLVGVHMGFLQVAAGLLAMAVLTAVHSRDLVEVNAAKMPLVLCTAIAATAVLASSRHMVWVPAAILATGCGVGSFFASRWSVAKGHGAVRGVVLTITVVVLVRLLWQAMA